MENKQIDFATFESMSDHYMSIIKTLIACNALLAVALIIVVSWR